MPGRTVSRGARRQDGVDEFFRQEIQTYRKALDTARYERKLNDDRARGEKLLIDMFKKPNPECEALMARAHRLDDAGRLEEAAALYARVLSCPDQADNHELRNYLAALIARLNRQHANAKLRARQADLQEEAGAAEQQLLLRKQGQGRGGTQRAAGQAAGRGGQRPRTAGPAFAGAAPLAWQEPGRPRADKPVGPMMPMPPDAYRAELAAQAMAARRAQQEGRKQAELLEQKQVALAAAMEALEQHRRQVVGGNDRLARHNERHEERRDREEDRIRRYYLEWEELRAAKEAAAGSPLGGEGEYDRRRREQIQQAHAHRALARNATEAPQDPRALYHDALGHDPWVKQQDLAAAAAAPPPPPYRAAVGGAAAAVGRNREQHYYYPGAGGNAPSLRQRPASAGHALTAAREREHERERERERELGRELERQRNNAANMRRHLVTSHPRAAAAAAGDVGEAAYPAGQAAGGPWGLPPSSSPSPPPPQMAWQEQPAAVGAGGRGKIAGGGSPGVAKAGGGVKAPFGRPGVDRPAVPINPQVVRAKQQAYIASRRKPDPPPQAPQVPLRARRAAERRPSPPQVAPGAVGGGWPLPASPER